MSASHSFSTSSRVRVEEDNHVARSQSEVTSLLSMYKMQRHPTAAVVVSLFVLQCAFCFTATGLQVGFGHNIGKASTRRLLGEEQKQTPPSSGQVSVESIGDKVRGDKV